MKAHRIGVFTSDCTQGRYILCRSQPSGRLRARRYATGVLIVQNDIGNKHSPTVIAAAITSRLDKAKLPTHIEVGGGTCGLAKDSVVLLEQIRTLDKKRLKEKMGTLDVSSMSAVNSGIINKLWIKALVK